MKYLKLFEEANEGDETFWNKIIKNADLNNGYTDDCIYKYEDSVDGSDDFEEFLTTMADTQEIYDGIHDAIYGSYKEECTTYLKNFPGDIFSDNAIKFIFEGSTGSTRWSSDGFDPLVGIEEIYGAIDNDYTYNFIYNTILEHINFDALKEFIKNDPSCYKEITESEFVHDEIKDKVIEKLKTDPELKPIIREIDSELWSFKNNKE